MRQGLAQPKRVARTVENPPVELDGAEVVCYVVLSEKHRRTGVYRHYIGGELMGPVPALAVCQYAGAKSVYLFHCDERWKVIQDDSCDSVEDALEQASVQYEGLERSDWDTATA
jgi:hypothetical protein